MWLGRFSGQDPDFRTATVYVELFPLKFNGDAEKGHQFDLNVTIFPHVSAVPQIPDRKHVSCTIWL